MKTEPKALESLQATLEETVDAPGARNYLYFAGGCLVLNFFLMAGEGIEIIGLFALLIAVPGLLARWTISACLYVAIVGYQVFDPGFFGLNQRYASYAMGRSGFPRPEKILLGFGVLGYAFAQFRLMGFWREVAPPRFRNRGEAALRTEGNLKRPFSNGLEEEFYGFVAQLVGCGVLALLFVIYFDDLGDRIALQVGPSLEKTLVAFAIFVAVLAGALTVFQLAVFFLENRTHSADRAYLALADELWMETKREQQRVDRWSKWTRQKTGRGRAES